MDDFEYTLKNEFLDEAAQSLEDTEQCFLLLETDPHNVENLNKIFRLAHNLKGSSKAVGFLGMSAFTHEFESFILKLKNNELQFNSDIMSLMLASNDHLLKMVTGLKQSHTAEIDSSELIEKMIYFKNSPQIVESTPEPEADIEPNQELLNELMGLMQTTVPDEVKPVAHEVKSVAHEVKSVVPEVEPQRQPILSPAPVISEAQKAQPTQPDESIRVSVTKLETLINYVGEMVILQSVLREQFQKTDSLLLRKTIQQLGKVSKEIQDTSMSLRMIPVKPTFQKMQRIVRDTALAVNKEVTIKLIGEDTELDKTVLEKISDPLVHLIRNSVDHGIENPTVREANGKSPKGEVILAASQRSGKLIIEVKDDGAGLNPEKLKAKAIEKGLLKPEAAQALSDKDAYNLIFAPGFSTKELVTDVSGRGVGMDVVKTNISQLSGEIQIFSQMGKGTTFQITLPLSLAIIEAMVVNFAKDKFVIPLNQIHETLRPAADQVQFSHGLGHVIMLRGENLPLFRLGDFFSQSSSMQTTDMIALIVRTGPKPYALLVDDIVGQFQVVIKKLGPELSGMKGVAGSTILGDGRPALIIDSTELLKRTRTSLGPKIQNVVGDKTA